MLGINKVIQKAALTSFQDLKRHQKEVIPPAQKKIKARVDTLKISTATVMMHRASTAARQEQSIQGALKQAPKAKPNYSQHEVRLRHQPHHD